MSDHYSSDASIHVFHEPGDESSYDSSDDISCASHTPPSSPCFLASIPQPSPTATPVPDEFVSVIPTSQPSPTLTPPIQVEFVSMLSSSQTPPSPNTPGISGTLLPLDLDTPPSSQPMKTPKRRGRPAGPRPKRGFYKGHPYHSKCKRAIPASTEKSATPNPSKSSPSIPYSLPTMRGYSSRSKVPSETRETAVTFRSPTATFQKEVHIPRGNRIIDISILCEVFTCMRCTHCAAHLVLYEDTWQHGWQTFFRVKCSRCHLELASFPSSRPLGSDPKSSCVNQSYKPREMNDITMKSVVSVHTTGMSWRDMHKLSTVFDLPPPITGIPSRYLDKLESVSKSAVSSSIDFFCKELCNFVDSKPSPEPNATNISVSFDSSWHTRGFYSNIGFGSAISTQTKKVVDYEILSRNCEKCSRWTDLKKKEKPVEFAAWMEEHKETCNRNFVGSSQKMEPEAARRIWARSLSKNLCYSTFIGDGDSKSFQEIKKTNPYKLVEVEKQECLTHVSKRLKKHLKTIKLNTKTATYTQHKLSEWKADYIAGNYSTVVLQQRGSTPEAISKALYVLLDHSAGDHSGCPKGNNSWCRWCNPSTPTPAVVTTFTPEDNLKVKEIFEIFASPDFCSHLTLALTQNANESLHNCIWNLSPKSKYVSAQSIRISTALAVLIFNESELALYTLLQELNLHPTTNSFISITKRLKKQISDHQSKVKSTPLRSRRRKRLIDQAREAALLRAEGGSSYREGLFGSERKRKLSPSTRGKNIKQSEEDTPPKRQRLVRERSSSVSSVSSTCSGSSGDSSTLCGICDDRLPDPVALRSVDVRGKEKLITDWVECSKCSSWVHCHCADIDADTASQVDNYVCLKH